MTKPSKRRMRSCHDGKKAYDTLNEAKAAAAAFVRRRDKKGDPVIVFMRAYGCACGKFHVGRTREINWDKLSALSDDRKPRSVLALSVEEAA